MDSKAIYLRYQELQRYLEWGEEDAQRVLSAAKILEPCFTSLIDDFYEEIERHPDASKVIRGGAEQVARLKVTLLGWLRSLFSGCYDLEYVNRRWQIGRKHVEIGLGQAYPDAALSRLRKGLIRALAKVWETDTAELIQTVESLNTLLDLDLAIIHEAYENEYMMQIQRSERLVAIGQVAGGIAHELRNPLNAVKTSAYYLTHARNPSPEKTKEHLQRIDRQVTLADSVITTLSDFAKLPTPDLQPFSIAECINEVLQSYPVSETFQVTFDCPSSSLSAQGDMKQIQIVFDNLIRNARDAMPEKGYLIITATQENQHIDIAFADNGTGISPEILNRITEPLFSTKARGIGLGLAIVQSILDKNKATLDVKSELDQGSVFTVHLEKSVT